ncbi:MAG TPA: polysaccharide deacetylase family protein [Anaerolineaceae bacterium]|nr:polysaccharide deacetylase family protein [Anaerolineaceae bacterium]
MQRLKRHLILIFCILAVLSANVQPATASSTKPTTQLPRKVLCPTPPSIMLHSADGVFGMQWLVRTIEKHSLQTMTYRQVSDLWKRGLCPPENTILVSLDDLGSNWLRKEFRDMIQVFTEKGLVLTLGLVTGTEKSPQNQVIWDYLRSLDAKGIEIASHSARHSMLEKLNEKDLRLESEESYRVLCEQLKRCPVTFILPFGKSSENSNVMNVLKATYTNIVSIQAAKIYGNLPLLFKRIPLVKQENNPGEPKLGAPFFIQNQVIHPNTKLPKQPNGTEPQ